MRCYTMPKILVRDFTEQNGAIALAHQAMDRYEQKPSADILDEAEKLLELAGDGHTDEEEASRDYAWGRFQYLDGSIKDAQKCLLAVLSHDPKQQEAVQLLLQSVDSDGLLVKTSKNKNPAISLRNAAFAQLREFSEHYRKSYNSNPISKSRGDNALHNAMTLAELALDNDPLEEDQRNHYLIGSIHMEMGEFMKAIEHAEKGVDHSNVIGVYHRQSERLYERMLTAINEDRPKWGLDHG